ncbi:MAG TPA: multidrug efflux RND transporter permease subunit [Candidatus Acidoferrales bacterium]|nr:multidrug efflux RND transporter permease subunit [Candidatus Acidoferrales bacterium]
MRLADFFIEHPRFATVLSGFVTLFGFGALTILPVAQYPEIVPPTVEVTTVYPGASADTVARTVATPLEQQINGVENMLYMGSQSTGDGRLTITVTFRIGTDLNVAQMLTQNRVEDALPRLPEDVQRLGVQVRKATPNILLAIHLYSPDKSRDSLYLSNYTTLHIKDILARLQGVGDVQFLGGREYAMRIWLDPDKVAANNLNASEVLAALRAQNLQVSAGILNQPPVPGHEAYQINVETLGRLSTPEQFGDIVVKSDTQGRVTRVRDIGRIEVGAADYGSTSYMDRSDSTALLIYAQPGANSLAVDHEVLTAMNDLKRAFPHGVDYKIIYDPTTFIAKSIREVVITIFVAILLVLGVVFLFLQNWRASIIPVVAIPVSLVGTFAILFALGISLNNLSLFGLVLAVGIVVDDAIVVVENVERNMRAGMSASDAAHKTMDEVGGALISIALTLCAVFVPSAFLSGISGLFFRQFAVTIAASTVISCFVSLTLSPALCAVLFTNHHPRGASTRGLAGHLFDIGFGWFNRTFEKLSDGYGNLTRRLVAGVAVVLVIYVALIGVAGLEFSRAQTGFIPQQDQGYLINIIQLPPGASLARTEEVVKQAADIILNTRGVEHVAPFAGLDATTSTVASNSGTIFCGLPSLYNHELPGATANTVLADLRTRLSVIKDARVLTIPPPPVPGLGSAGGFKMMLEDRAGLGSEALVRAANNLVTAANKDPHFAGVFTLFNTGSPSVYADIDRVKAQKVGVTPTDVFSTLQVYLGSQYVNDFNLLGRTYEVIVQADGQYRRNQPDIMRLKVRNASGEMVPIGTVAQLKDKTIPYRVPRYNLFPAAEVQGVAAPIVASGTALLRMEALAHKVLPQGIGFEWTDLSFQEQQQGTPTLVVFGAAALFVFLVLVAHYESWKLPIAIVLIMPMCLLASVSGLLARGLPIDILAQIGFVVLVGLAAKNAILIVEFARQKEEEGATAREAAIHAARTRLRPILMTSFAFILGVAPLAVATGAGGEMRRSLGTAVLFGMLGVTGFGLIFTPTFYTFIRIFGRTRKDREWTQAALKATAIILVIGLFTGGCAVGPHYQKPTINLAPFHNLATSSATKPEFSAPPLDKWWTGFHDPILVTVVERALDQNLDLAAAFARVRQARAAASAAGAQLLPTADLEATATAEHQSLVSPFGSAANGSPGYRRDQRDYTVGPAASWEIDLSGGLRRGAAAAADELQAAQAEQVGTRITVAAEAADAYLQVREFQARLSVAQQLIDTDTHLLNLVDARRRAGVADDREIAQAEALLKQANATVPSLRVALEAQLNRLDVLMGAQPGTYAAELSKPGKIPGIPAIGGADQPLDVLRRRPDIIAAERRLAASNERIGVAISDYYPKISLSGALGFESINGGTLLNGKAFQPVGAGALRWRLFDFGKVADEVAQSRGAYAEALAEYRQAALRATEDVENALMELAQTQVRLHDLQGEVASLTRARDLSERAYEAGAIPLTDVLDADRQLLVAQNDMESTRAGAARAAVRTFRALGGGWDVRSSPILASVK